MQYIGSLVLLFVGMLLYFKIAKKYRIIDKPNHRSSHTLATIRGGGVVFVFAFILFLISIYLKGMQLNYPHNFLIFGSGFLVLTTVSFVDDLIDSPARIRFIYQFVSVSILIYFLHLFSVLSIYWLPIVYVFIIGILNAYNFMDGVNGMSGLYSLSCLLTLYFIQYNVTGFTEIDFIIFPILACLVFLFFNLRRKAKCFMGDVGSMGIAYWILGLIGLLMIKTGELKWILLLSVYGVEVVLTIIERLRLKENIFEAHKRHLYQLLVNEKKINHVVVSFFYSVFQIVINVFLVFTTLPFWQLCLIILLPTALIYLFLKFNIKKQVSLTSNSL